jgi:Secretion system C-terminal sorting domain/Putative serine esterase (DUF676)
MKSIKISWVALLCLLFTNLLSAQDSIIANNFGNKETNYTQIFDRLNAKGLPQDRVPFGVLYNRVYPWAKLQYKTNHDYVNNDQIVRTWNELTLATYQLPNKKFEFHNFYNVVSNDWLSYTMPIVVFNYQFACLDSTAIENEGLTIDSIGTYVDLLKPEVPYTNNLTQYAGIMYKQISEGQTAHFKASDMYYLNNTDAIIKEIKFTNLTDNKTITINSNGEFDYLFGTPNDNEILLEITLSNGTKFKTLQKIFIKPNKKTRSVCDKVFDAIIESSIPFQGYNETEATTSYGDYHVYLRYKSKTSTDCEDALKKPVIFLDGFDDQDSRNFDDIYKDYLTINGFNTSNARHLVADSLRRNGIDVVILNFPKLGATILTDDMPLKVSKTVKNAAGFQVSRVYKDGGTDFIERNAMVFIALVQKLNQELFTNGSNEKISIIGPSMGGQISRYGLAYMERELSLHPTVTTWNHNCRLYMSMDSPHEGANVAISTQQALVFFGYSYNDAVAELKYVQKIRSVAARQLLIEQMDGLNGSAIFHTTYYNNLNNGGLSNSHGYPENLRKVTLVNGSGDGLKTTTEGFAAMDYYAQESTFGWTAMDLHLKYMPITGGIINTLDAQALKQSMVKGWTGIAATWNSWSGNPTNNMSFDEKYNTYNVNTIMSWSTYHHHLEKFIKSYLVTNVNTHGSMDVVPGGLLNSTEEVFLALHPQIVANSSVCSTSYQYNANHCFIPTISGLGFKNSNFPWVNKVSDRNLLCSVNGNELYFDNYFAPKTNEPHVNISKEACSWAIQEVLKGHKGPDCLSPCATYTLTGDIAPCNGNIAEYTISPAVNSYNYILPPGLNVAYSPGIGKSMIYFNTDSKTQFAGMPTVNCLLTAEILNPCGADKVTASLTVKAYSKTNAGKNAYITLKPDPITPCTFNAYALWHPNATYEWYNVYPFGGNPIPTITSSPISPFGPYTSTSGMQNVWVKINSCGGSSAIIYRNINITGACSTGNQTAWLANFANEKPTRGSNFDSYEEPELTTLQIENDIQAFPNPSNTYWNIVFKESINEPVAYALYDITGNKIDSKIIDNIQYHSFKVDCQNLAEGTYILSTHVAGRMYKIKLIKN